MGSLDHVRMSAAHSNAHQVIREPELSAPPQPCDLQGGQRDQSLCSVSICSLDLEFIAARSFHSTSEAPATSSGFRDAEGAFSRVFGGRKVGPMTSFPVRLPAPWF